MYKLQIRDDEGRTTVVPLLRDEVTIGRREGNTIRLTERNVSRRHARLEKKNGRIYVEDLSRYGTRINGRRISEAVPVEAGDSILIGDYELSLNMDAAALEEHAAAAPAGRQDAATAPGAAPPAEKDDATALVSGELIEAVDRAAPVGLPRLVCVGSSLAGTEYEVNTSPCTIGRTEDNDLIIDHRSISRNHARLEADGANWTIVDLDSANGLKVNGEEYKQASLHKGDIVELGHVQLRFVEPGEAWSYEGEAPERASSRPKQLVILAILAVLAIGAAVAWFGYFSKPLEEAGAAAKKVDPAAKTAAKGDESPAPAAEARPKAEPEAPPEPEAKPDASAQLEAGSDHLAAGRWDDAVKAFESALAVDAGSEEADKGLARARSEKKAGAAYSEITTLMQDGQVEDAFGRLSDLVDIPEDSSFHARAAELRTAVQTGYVAQLIDKGWQKYRKGRFRSAISLSEQALEIEEGNEKAAELLEKAKAKKAGDDGGPKGSAEPEAKPDPPKPKPPKPKPEPEAKPEAKPDPPKAAGSAKDLYKQARKLHNSSPKEAMKLYEQAAKRGYAKAYRQLGSLHIQQGSKPKAIAAYKKYLKLAPGAADAEVIKNTIIRLGGSAP